MSKLRADILVFLTRESGHLQHVSMQRFQKYFPRQFHCNPDEIGGALDDLKHFGLIEVSPLGISLSQLSKSRNSKASSV